MLRVGGLFALVSVVALGSSGCFKGYQKASELEQERRGPNACAQSCQELGMHMAAFVLVERQISGCVCEPNMGGPPPPAARASAGATAGGMAVILAERQRQQQQQQAAAAAAHH